MKKSFVLIVAGIILTVLPFTRSQAENSVRHYTLTAGGQTFELDAKSGVSGELMAERWKQSRLGERINPAIFAGIDNPVQRLKIFLQACVDLLRDGKLQERDIAKSIFKVPYEREMPDPAADPAKVAAGRKQIEALQSMMFELNNILRDGKAELYQRGLPKEEIQALDTYQCEQLAGIVEHPKAKP
jgi:hypothetical protein